MAEKWDLSGTYFETCNCEVACPCVFLSAPSTGECTVVVAWHIDRGHYGNVALDGLNVALAAYSPGHMITTKWQAALYFDDKANAQQNEALMQIFTGQAGGHPAVLVSFVGKVLGASRVGINYEAKGKTRRLKIGDIAQAEIEAMDGAGGADVTISGHPLAIAPGHPAMVSKSKQLSYHDHGLNWELSGKTGFFSPFTYQGG